MRLVKSSKKWLSVAGLTLTLILPVGCQQQPTVVAQDPNTVQAPVANAYMPPATSTDDWLWLYYMNQNNAMMYSYYYSNPYSYGYIHRYYSAPPRVYNYYNYSSTRPS